MMRMLAWTVCVTAGSFILRSHTSFKHGPPYHRHIPDALKNLCIVSVNKNADHQSCCCIHGLFRESPFLVKYSHSCGVRKCLDSVNMLTYITYQLERWNGPRSLNVIDRECLQRELFRFPISHVVSLHYWDRCWSFQSCSTIRRYFINRRVTEYASLIVAQVWQPSRHMPSKLQFVLLSISPSRQVDVIDQQSAEWTVR